MSIHPGMPVRLVVCTHDGERIGEVADVDLGEVSDPAGLGQEISGQLKFLARRARRCIDLRDRLTVQGEERAKALVRPGYTINEARAHVARHPGDGDLCG